MVPCSLYIPPWQYYMNPYLLLVYLLLWEGDNYTMPLSMVYVFFLFLREEQIVIFLRYN